MFRRVFLAGIEDGHWGLIKDLHENAKSVVKWEGLSEVVLMIPRCVALSTDGILLGPKVKVKLLCSCLHCLWEMFRATLFVGCNS
jgi:hypothetical protein